MNITGKTKIGELFDTRRHLIDDFVARYPEFGQLKNPIAYKTMSKIATIEMVAQRHGKDQGELIAFLQQLIEQPTGG